VAKARETTGLRWAPETAPMNRMIAMTMRPGATTAAGRLILDDGPQKLTTIGFATALLIHALD
jgi:hypothetical protein